MVAFLGQHLDDPLAVVERKLNLPQIDVPVKRQLLRRPLRAMVTPPVPAPPAASSNPITTARFMRQPRLAWPCAKLDGLCRLFGSYQKEIGKSSLPTGWIILNAPMMPGLSPVRLDGRA